jgi:hypothetical protein
MPLKIDLLPLEPSIPGQARLSIKKWQGSAERLEFSIQRNQDHYYLQGGQQWSNNPFWFKVAHFSVVADGESLETIVGADVVDPLLEGTGHSQVRFELREQGLGYSDKGVPRPHNELLSSAASGNTPSSGGSADLPAPATPAPPVPAEPLPTAEPELVTPVEAVVPAAPVVTPAARKKSFLLPLIIALIVLAAAAAGAWWWFNKKPDAPVAVGQPTSPAPAPIASNGACTAESMASESELGFVQNCIKQAPDSAALLKIIESAKAGNHCGIAQRLYANRAQNGDMQIATAYAHEYDPKYHQASSCFAEPDKATAAYWYETILGHEPDNADAKARFEELKP